MTLFCNWVGKNSQHAQKNSQHEGISLTRYAEKVKDSAGGAISSVGRAADS